MGLAHRGRQEKATSTNHRDPAGNLLITGNKAATGKGLLLEPLFSWGHSESETGLIRAGVKLFPVCTEAPAASTSVCY